MVRGVAILDGLLYVVCELSSVIHVFDTKTYKNLDDIKVLNMDDPNDIVACSRSRLLFIADCRTDKPNCVGCLWKVTPTGKVTRWLLRGGLSPYSLSIRNGRILVVPLHGKQLLIFNAEQQLKKKIALPKRMEPRHAVETVHGTIIISHWGKRKGAKVFQIGEFDAAGNNVKTFSGSDDLNDFPYVCLDVTGRLLVVDSWNSRVILLNKDLQRGAISV